MSDGLAVEVADTVGLTLTEGDSDVDELNDALDVTESVTDAVTLVVAVNEGDRDVDGVVVGDGGSCDKFTLLPRMDGYEPESYELSSPTADTTYVTDVVVEI